MLGCVYHSPLPDQKQVIKPMRMEAQAQAPNVRLRDMHGKLKSLADYKGKYVLVNFFATWCKSCVYELPTLSNLKESLGRDDFVVLAIGIDEQADKLKRFANEQDLNIEFLNDEFFEAKQAFAVSSLPVTFLIDKDQTLLSFFDPIRHANAVRVEGFETWDSKYMVDGFKKLLN